MVMHACDTTYILNLNIATPTCVYLYSQDQFKFVLVIVIMVDSFYLHVQLLYVYYSVL